jgi:hypothetical protein
MITKAYFPFILPKLHYTYTFDTLFNIILPLDVTLELQAFIYMREVYDSNISARLVTVLFFGGFNLTNVKKEC